jgi:hypothetical protein
VHRARLLMVMVAAATMRKVDMIDGILKMFGKVFSFWILASNAQEYRSERKDGIVRINKWISHGGRDRQFGYGLKTKRNKCNIITAFKAHLKD